MKEFNELNDELILYSVYRIRNDRKEELLNNGDYLLKSWLIPEILKACRTNNDKLINEEDNEEEIEIDNENVKENLNMLLMNNEMEDEFIKLFNENYEFSSIFYSNLNVLNSKNPPRIPEYKKKKDEKEEENKNTIKEEKNESLLSFPVEMSKYKKYYKDLRKMKSFAIDSDDVYIYIYLLIDI